MVLSNDTISQELLFVSEMWDVGPYLIWAGDLDRDGKLDLIMDLKTHENTSQIGLFLSSKSTKSNLLKLVALRSSVGC